LIHSLRFIEEETRLPEEKEKNKMGLLRDLMQQSQIPEERARAESLEDR